MINETRPQVLASVDSIVGLALVMQHSVAVPCNARKVSFFFEETCRVWGIKLLRGLHTVERGRISKFQGRILHQGSSTENVRYCYAPFGNYYLSPFIFRHSTLLYCLHSLANHCHVLLPALCIYPDHAI